MMKTPKKLVLRSQIVRVLAHVDLMRAVGGVDSGDVRCPDLVDSGAKACDTAVAVVATTACG